MVVYRAWGSLWFGRSFERLSSICCGVVAVFIIGKLLVVVGWSPWARRRRSCARALLAGFILADIPLAPILLADIILADVLLADIVLATSFSVFSVFDIAQGASARTLLDSARLV